jgi:methyl-accepting chemotaxis protein
MNLPFRFSDLRTKPKILIGVLSPMVLLVLLGGIAIFNINSITQTNERVEHTHNVLSMASGIVGSAVDMETGMRGYLLAGKEGFLAPYQGGQEATYSGITSLQETVSDNPKQVARLAEVEKVLREWQSNVTEPTIALRHKIGDASTMNDMAALVGEAKGKVFFDRFRKEIATFIDRETKLLNERHAAFKEAEKIVAEGVVEIEESGKWVEHTYEVLADASSLLAHAVDMETGMRGFLLAGQDDFLAPCTAGKSRFFEEFKALQETVNDNPAQVKVLQESEKTIRQWIDNVTEPAIALRREVAAGKRSLAEVEALVSKKLGKKYFDAFRGQIASFSNAEAALIEERHATAAKAEKAVASNLELMQKNEEWVTHTYKVIQSANAILSSAVDMETGMRGYLLAGQEDFLAPYNAGKKGFYDGIESLTKTVSDNAAQVQLLNETKATITDWQSKVTEPTIALRRKIGSAKTMDDMADLIGEARGKKYFDEFRSLMAAFSDEETGLMDVRRADNASKVSSTYMK